LKKKVAKKNTTYVIDKYPFFSSIFLSTLCRQTPSSSKEEYSFLMEKGLFDVKVKVLFYPPNFPNPKMGLCIWPNRDVEFSEKIFPL